MIFAGFAALDLAIGSGIAGDVHLVVDVAEKSRRPDVNTTCAVLE